MVWLVLFKHFRSAILDAWRGEVAADLCDREGFRGGPLLDIYGSLQLLDSAHVRERDKSLLRVSWLVVFGMVTFWAESEASLHLAGFVVHLIMMVTFLGNAPFLPFLRSAKILNFTIL